MGRLSTKAPQLGLKRVFQKRLAGIKDSIQRLSKDRCERKRSEEALKSLAQTFADLSGKPFFEAISRHIARALGVDYVYVGQLDATKSNVSILGGYARGEAMGDLTYSLTDTPCHNVIGQKVRVYCHGVQSQFPKDLLLTQMGIEGYIGAPIFDKQGQPIGILVALHSLPLSSHQDVIQLFNIFLTRVAAEMQRSKAQLDLERSEERHRSIVQTAMDGFWMADMQGRLLEVNEAYCRMSGYNQSELLSMCFQDLESDEARDITISHIHKVMAKGQERFESRHRRKDGSIFDVEISVHYCPFEGGQIVAFLRDITERRRIEKEIKDSEERFRELVASVTDYIYTVKIHNAKVSSTIHGPGCATVTGYSSAEYERDPHLWYRMVHEEDKPLIQELSKKMLSGIEVLPLEHRIIHKKGSLRWVRHTPVPSRDPNGALIGYDGLISDITARKMAEEALRKSEELLRQVVKHDPYAIAVHDLNMCYIAASDRWLADYNVKEADLIGKSHYEVFPEIPKRWKDIHQRCLAGAVERNDDDYFERPDGSVTYNRWELRPWYQLDGKIGGVIFYTEVTTEQKLAEQARKSIIERYNLATLAAGFGVWDWDVQKDHSIWDDRMFELYRIKKEDFSDDHAAWVNSLHPDDKDFAVEELQKALRGEKEYDTEYRIVWPDGTVRHIKAYAQTMRDAGGRALRQTGVNYDVTESKLAEAKLRASIKEKETLLQELNHRVNNNLQLVSSLLRLQRKHVLDKNVMAVLDDSQNRIRAIALIHEKLYLKKGLSGINIREYISELAESVVRSFKIVKNKVVLNMDVENVTINIQQAITCGLVINELLSNALKYAFSTPKHGKIEISLRRKGAGNVELIVSDNGVGIPEGIELKTARTLGIQLIYTLVERQLEGSISLERERGTTYKIEFQEVNEDFHDASEGM